LAGEWEKEIEERAGRGRIYSKFGVESPGSLKGEGLSDRISSALEESYN
jgi:hypothetical protein